MDLKFLVYLFAVFSLSRSDSDQKDPDRIVGGELCKPKQFPSVVVLFIYHELIEGNGQCTGSIIASKWVITVAHCYRDAITDIGGDLNTAVTTVIAGTVDHYAVTEEEQWRTSVRHIVHERYPGRPKVRNQDIALVEVDEPFYFNVFVDKVTMATFPRGWANLPSTSVGFGLTTWTTPIYYNTRLFYINTSATDFMFCMIPMSIYDTLMEEHLCADPVKIGTLTHYGDSGGPLLYRRFLVGVLVGLLPIDDYYAQIVYQKVSFFEDWIRQHVPEIPPMEQWPLKANEPRSEEKSSASSATVAGVSVLTIAFWLSILVGSDRTSA